MPTTDDELIIARSWIGESEDQEVFDERFDRHFLLLADRIEALNSAIEESLRAQLAVMTLDQPSSASAEGISYSNVQNIVTLRENLEKFEASKGSGKAAVTKLIRKQTR